MNVKKARGWGGWGPRCGQCDAANATQEIIAMLFTHLSHAFNGGVGIRIFVQRGGIGVHVLVEP